MTFQPRRTSKSKAPQADKRRVAVSNLLFRGCGVLLLLPFIVCPPRRSSAAFPLLQDRKSVVSGKSVSVRVDLGGRRIIKKKQSRNSDSCRSEHRKNQQH